jgi:hypothetical protein
MGTWTMAVTNGFLTLRRRMAIKTIFTGMFSIPIVATRMSGPTER